MAITFTGGKTWANGDIANATNMNLIVNALTTSMATSRLLGRTTAGAGSFEEITPGAGLDYSSTAISVGWIDTNSTHYLRIAAGSDLTADRTLTLTTGDAARTLTLSGNPSLSGVTITGTGTLATGTSTLTLTGSPSISGVTITGTGTLATGTSTLTLTGNMTGNQDVSTTGAVTFASLSTGSGAISGGAISGTTASFSGIITGTASGGALSLSGATTNNRRLDISNTGQSTSIGVESSAGGAIIVGSTAYATVINSGAVVPVQIGVNSALVATFTSTGLNNTVIGATTAAAGSFTTLSVSGSTNLDAGTVSAPGLYLEGETGTGLYRIGANNHGYAVSGSKVLDIASTGLGVTGQVTSTTFLRAGTTNVHATTVGISAYDNSANTQIGLGQSGGSLILQWVYNATAANASAEITSSTSNPLTIIGKRVYVDTSVAASLRVENNGDVVFGPDSALATSATAQFVHIRTMAGAPSGSPTNYTGHAVHCVDTTNGRAYYYYGAAWHYATLT